MSEIYNLKESVQNIADKLATHVGGGDVEHQIVDRQHAGFMSSEQYIGLFTALGFRSQIPANTDVFKLSPGHYIGSNLINSSKGKDDSSILMIDVFQYREFYKQIFEINGSDGSIKNYNYYLNGKGVVNDRSPVGWSNVERYVVLWEGNISTTNVKANFSDSADKYRYLRVTTATAEGSVKQTIIKNNQEVLINDHYVTSDSLSANFYAMKLFIVGAYASIENLLGVDMKNSGNIIHSGSTLSLLKIEGVI